MISKATILIAICLVFFGYRWGKRKTQAQQEARQAAQASASTAAPRKEWISVRTLLFIVAILLIIAILSSLSGRIG